jgi:hypothetical protein
LNSSNSHCLGLYDSCIGEKFGKFALCQVSGEHPGFDSAFLNIAKPLLQNITQTAENLWAEIVNFGNCMQS